MSDMQSPKFCPFIGRSCVGLRCMFSDLNSPDKDRACLFLRVLSVAGAEVAVAFSQSFLDQRHKSSDSASEGLGAGH